MDGRGDPPMSSRHSNLKKSFKLGIRSLLTAFSKEDVEKAFPAITNSERESLYLMFVQVLKSLHENIEEEFESICQETEVGKTLDIIEQLVEEHTLDVLAADKTDIGGITEKILKAKKDEIQCLTSLLQKVDDYNSVMKARIESLKTSQDLSTADIVEQLRSWNGNFEKYRGSLNG
ncbi:hypothetical protein C4D60_Mb01t04430 [Musa balbisiana]|uniref:Uncharacterized protein n=1 Tax=Musa balbisiana TaxID=52838 RepID=A0A4S8JK18_MUSBA|nr:hypothetical protein C4D60_Mb01t04430 [Musa balbisiana]